MLLTPTVTRAHMTSPGLPLVTPPVSPSVESQRSIGRRRDDGVWYDFSDAPLLLFYVYSAFVDYRLQTTGTCRLANILEGVLSPHLTLSRLTSFRLNREAVKRVSSPWLRPIRILEGRPVFPVSQESVQAARPTAFWLVATTTNWVVLLSLTLDEMRSAEDLQWGWG